MELLAIVARQATAEINAPLPPDISDGGALAAAIRDNQNAANCFTKTTYVNRDMLLQPAQRTNPSQMMVHNTELPQLVV